MLIMAMKIQITIYFFKNTWISIFLLANKKYLDIDILIKNRKIPGYRYFNQQIKNAWIYMCLTTHLRQDVIVNYSVSIRPLHVIDKIFSS